MDQKCESCKFYDGKSCRRYPPRYRISGQFGDYENPIVEATSWCGEYQKKDGTTLLSE